MATSSSFSESSDAAHGGYSYVFVDGDPPNKFVCYICTLPARDPQQVTCCFNIYCHSCLLQLKEKGEGNFNCPTCRQPLTGNYFKDGRADREIKSLIVYCPGECEWVGVISDIEAHLNTCPYQLLDCTNRCGEKVQRQLLELHLTDSCVKRLVVCQYCKEEGSYGYIEGVHLESCLKYPVKCCNDECDQMIPRRALEGHITICCKTIVSCEYSNVGCKKEMKREEQDIHNKESVNEHLRLAVEKVKSLQEDISILKSDIKAIKTPSTNSIKKLVNAEVECIKSDIKALQTKRKTYIKVFKVTQFEHKRNNSETWKSSSFYTSPGGYKVKLVVYTNGHSKKSLGYVSCFTQFVTGDNDDTLEWPFVGYVTIELLNQLDDENHVVHTYYYDETIPEFARQRDSESGCGIDLFVSHIELDTHQSSTCTYLKDDTLYFRISINATSTTKPWLSGSFYV
ncbi:PREDICTED: TNF receptor-associated factor 2-like [Amphimedon queenslandica]|nr:PREDICTED: TNF receptor-associated factor 2-like [Amphimedon queenslandica]|eukprot:XP_011409733.1 PREDICTED: TNF receptor-associated factor 2-like [Amphimedon queenslandica]